MNFNDVNARIPTTFERRNEPVEIVKELPEEEDEILVSFSVQSTEVDSCVVYKNGDVYTIKFNEGELVENSEGKSYFEDLIIRRNDLKLTQDEIKQIANEDVYAFEILPDFD